MEKGKITQYFFVILFALFLILSVIILKPYGSFILLGIVFAIVTQPLFKKMSLKIGRIPSAILIDLLILVILVIPFYYIMTFVIKEANLITLNLRGLEEVINTLSSLIGVNINLNNLMLYLTEFVRRLFYLDQEIIVSHIVDTLIGILVFLVVIFYGLLEGGKIYRWFKQYFPLKPTHRKRFMEKIEKTINSFMYGNLLGAVAQGITLGLGFYIFGIPNAKFWGFLAAILSFIPIVGPPLIWVPATIFLFMNNNKRQCFRYVLCTHHNSNINAIHSR